MRRFGTHTMDFLEKNEEKDYEDASLFKDFIKVVNLSGAALHLVETDSVEGRLHNMMRGQAGTDKKNGASVFDKRFKDNTTDGAGGRKAQESRFRETSVLNNIFKDKCVVENRFGGSTVESRFRSSVFESKYEVPEKDPRRVLGVKAEEKAGKSAARRNVQLPGQGLARRSASTSCILMAEDNELQCFQGREESASEAQAWPCSRYYSFDSHKFAHDKPIKKRYRFKSYDEATDRLARIKKCAFKAPESGEGFVCAYCGTKYVYKRCLVNHLLKSHRKVVKHL